MSISAAGIGPAGLGQSTLELLADPKKLAKTHKSLEEAQARAQKTIDLAGPATEIIVIRAEVATELERQRAFTAEAEKAYDQKMLETQTKADDMIATARDEGIAIIDAANDERDEVRKDAAQVKAGATEMNRKLDARKAEWLEAADALVNREKALDAQEDANKVRSEELTELNRSLLKEKTRLAEAREHLSTLLG